MTKSTKNIARPLEASRPNFARFRNNNQA